MPSPTFGSPHESPIAQVVSDRGEGRILDSDFWDELILLIEQGSVVPIVGQELLTMEDGGTFYPWVTRKLVERLGIPPEEVPEDPELDKVAGRFLADRNQSRQRVATRLVQIVSDEGDIAIPEPLRKLAEIPAFRLFITTTFDPLLERAINQVRYGGQDRTDVLSYSPEDRQDLSGDPDDADGTLIYHMFGKLSGGGAFVITQEDRLEFVHALLQADDRNPNRLFYELNQKNLLVLGSNFGGWLARFFMRLARAGRLRTPRDTTDYLIDERVRGDANLVFFMEHLASGISVVEEAGAVEFVDELHRRWFERNPNSRDSDSWDVEAPTGPAPGSVFVSYARQDEKAARRIKEELEREVDVFFDRDDIYAGDDWEAKIKLAIRQSSLFIPIISGEAVNDPDSYFWTEWQCAVHRALTPERQGQNFVLPVVIDDTGPENPMLPAFFARRNWTSLPQGEVNSDFVTMVTTLFRRYQEDHSR